MADRSKHWWKCPDDFYSKPELRELKTSAQLALVWLRCLESEGFFKDGSHAVKTIAWTLRVPEKSLARDLDALRSAGFVDESGCPIVTDAASGEAKTDAGRQDEKRFMDALKKYLSQFLARDLSRTDENLSRDKNDSVRDKNDSVTPRARVENRTDIEQNPPSPLGGSGVTDSAKFIYPMTDAEAASVGRLVAGWPGIGGVATPGVRGAFCAARRVFGVDAEDLLAAVEEQKSHGWFSGERRMPRLEKWLGERYWAREFVEADASQEKKNGATPAQGPLVAPPEERFASIADAVASGQDDAGYVGGAAEKIAAELEAARKAGVRI